MTYLKSPCLVVLGLFGLFACTAEVPAVTSVTVMTFNVENLFDNLDDPDKDDKAYLPRTAKQGEAHISACNEIAFESFRNECLYLDWTDAAVEQKLTVLAETIRQVNGGKGADIIAMQEVENATILNRLRTEKLAELGYLPAVLIEGTDLRGIDVAILSKFPLAAEPQLHPLSLPEFPDRAGDTRGVLQADFRLPDGSLLTAFSVHFPAPFHPTAMRVAAYEHLNALLHALPDRPPCFCGRRLQHHEPRRRPRGPAGRLRPAALDPGARYRLRGLPGQLFLSRRRHLVVPGHDFVHRSAWRKNNSSNSRGFRANRQPL